MIQAQIPDQTIAALEAWNGLDASAAAAAILPCNGSRAWASAMARLRPFASPAALFDASDRVWLALTESDWQQAFDSHPRIGEYKAKSTTVERLQWTSAERSQPRCSDPSGSHRGQS
jgi:2-oxo-4-hydroxy-4-carboxy-5-ureidoimidazoline decarboxylase